LELHQAVEQHQVVLVISPELRLRRTRHEFGVYRAEGGENQLADANGFHGFASRGQLGSAVGFGFGFGICGWAWALPDSSRNTSRFFIARPLRKQRGEASRRTKSVRVIPCQRCNHRPATRTLIDAVGIPHTLCEQCAPPQKMLLPVLMLPNHAVQQACPSCGTTLQQLRQSSLLGCGECYRFFRAPLLQTLGQLHGAVVHRGCRPGSVDPGELQPGRRESLQRALKEAIAEERYEDAAVARDRLREL
jgi:protein-arginine kinase activator protein McsA